MVATGVSNSGHSSNVEIIDLEIASSSCQNLEEYPIKIREAGGGLLPDGSPLVCGGSSSVDVSDCYNFDKNEWKVFSSLTEAKRAMKATIIPFLMEDFQLAFVGGYKNGLSINSTEVLTNEGWRTNILPQIPVPRHGHCILLLNSTTVIMIGPYETFFMTENLIWTEGPAMKIPRYYSSCGRIIKGDGSNKLNVISAGGSNSDVVEIFDAVINEWLSGPHLPFAIDKSEMVEDPLGGVVLVGGQNSNGKVD